jgi:Tfp pilus assembly PilM family ATPase
VKSIILELEELPHKKEDAEKIIKWKLANRLGINLRDSFFDYQVLSRQGMVKVFVASIRKDIITALESTLFDLGFNVQRISMHSLNLLNLLALEESTDVNFSVIIHIDNYFSVMIFKKGVLDYYRCKISVEHIDNFVKELKASFLSYRCVNPDISVQKNYLFDDYKGLEEIVRNNTEACVESIKLESLLSIKESLQVNAGDKLKLLAALGAGAGI